MVTPGFESGQSDSRIFNCYMLPLFEENITYLFCKSLVYILLDLFLVSYFLFPLYAVLFIYFFDGTGVWIQALELAGQVLYQMSHASSPFCFSYFLNKVSHLCLG
jgi:hypothetical protein